MFARIEVALRPEFPDPPATLLLRRLELVNPDLRRKVRWGRLLEVHWFDLPPTREEVIGATSEIFWDKVTQWLFTGNLIPSAAGKTGGIQDLMEAAPQRPGKFWALERRFRPGVTDSVARTSLEAFQALCHQPVTDGRAASGALLLLEGPHLTENDLGMIARDVFCNELLETWTIFDENDLKKNDRFHPERVKRDLPRIWVRPGAELSSSVERVDLSLLSEDEAVALSRRRLWGLSREELSAIRNHFADPRVLARRAQLGLSPQPTDAEMEVFSQSWSEQNRHKVFNARVHYRDFAGTQAQDWGAEIPGEVDSLFRTTIAGTTEALPKSWLLSVFHDNAGILAWDDERSLCIKVECAGASAGLDPYGGALTGMIGVNRDILGTGLGARPLFNTSVFCLPPPDTAQALPDRVLHSRRILDGVRRGVETASNLSGVPLVNGATFFDERYLGNPLVFSGTAGWLPREAAGRRTELKEVQPGDRVCMVGGRIGKDGLHSSAFAGASVDEGGTQPPVQLGDPLAQRRLVDFLIEARDLGLYRCLTDNGVGGLATSVGELARLSGGARIDLARAQVKYPGIRPSEILISESQERMTVSVPPDRLGFFLALATRRGVEVSDLGEFTEAGLFEVFYGATRIAALELHFLQQGCPRLRLNAEWRGLPPARHLDSPVSFGESAGNALLALLSRPGIASKEWMIRQLDHEVQGQSVIKPLHGAQVGTSATHSGPNDAAVLQPRRDSFAGIVVASGLQPRLSTIDPYLMAMATVDEAVRNLLCAGAEFGHPENLLALVDNFSWPDPTQDPELMGGLVRAAFGLRRAALELSAPLISGKDSVRNDFRGHAQQKPVHLPVLPTLLVTALGRCPDVRFARSSDFKNIGDVIYLIGKDRLGLRGTEIESLTGACIGPDSVATPDWELARRVYSWIGRGQGFEQSRLRSLHDVSDGGLLVSIAESLLARGFGAQIVLPDERDPWEIAFGEGFHAFVATTAEAETAPLEAEWLGLGVPFVKLGRVTGTERLEVRHQAGGAFSVDVKQLRTAWSREGFWE